MDTKSLRYGLSLVLFTSAPAAFAGNWGEDWGSMTWEAFTSPQAPSITSVEPGYGELKVSFDTGLDGGSTILDYRVTCGGISVTSDGSPAYVRGLEDDRRYNCTVTARNAIGRSDSSASAAGRTTEGLIEGINLIIIHAATKDEGGS